MARAVLLFLLFLLPLLSYHLTAAVTASGSGGPTDGLLRGNEKERLTRLRFYWHDTSAGPNPSAVLVAQSATKSASSFGTVKVMDDPLTVGPNRSSLLVGKSQGIYVSADKDTSGLLMAMTFSFVVGKYNGSTLAVVGRNEVKTHTREMAITGGTGLLRFATGYVQARTYSFDPTIGYTIVEYSCYFVTSPLKLTVPEYSHFI
ncbi:hypothetical protein KSP39_PZI011810 [Platanthera zijinensis]|uniref:Dirigent protein n=1 Tax=Platanthera zijinensis TaxID=2320716 RepID=A0AAP0BF98_9ASPA